jgi:hypothetical protein
MATDQDEKTTSDAIGVTFTSNDCDVLLAKFSTGNTINAADVVTLLSYYNNYASHKHTVDDLSQKDTFGNLAGDQTFATEDEEIGLPNNINTAPTSPSAGSVAQQSLHTQLRDAFNSLRIHVHTFIDSDGQ